MPKFTIKPQPIVDAEFVELGSSRPVGSPQAPTQGQVQPVQRNPMSDVIDLSVDTSANPSIALALYEKRARAVSMFVEIPLLAFITFSDKTPGLIRLGAGILAIWKSVELARGGAIEAQATATEWAGQ